MGAFELYQHIQGTLQEMTTATRRNSPRIHMVTYLSHDIVPYAAYALVINLAYATANGYSFEVLDETTSNFEPRDQRWNRVKILLDRLEFALKYPEKRRPGDDDEYLVWMDADLIFTNHSHILDNYIANHTKADILLSAERHAATGVGNTGCMLVKVSEWSLQFFHRWWNDYDRSLDHDQIYFNILYRSMTPGITEHVAILPSYALNSHPPAALHQKGHHYVLHLMGERMDVRSSLFYNGYLNLCESYNQAETDGNHEVNIPPQLGLSKRVLLQTTFERYCTRYQELYDGTFMSWQVNDVNDVSIFLANATELREIIIQAVKYASFLMEQQKDEDLIPLNEIITTDSNFDRMVLNKLDRFKVREMMFIRTREIISMQAVVTSNRNIAVQLLNACAVFGHDLANEMESLDQKMVLLDDIHLILKELRPLVSSESTHLVDEMISGNYVSQGIISSNTGSHDDAIVYFQEAVNVLEKNPNKNMFHLFPPLSLLGIEKCKFVHNSQAVQDGINILSHSLQLQRQILEPEMQLKENHLDFASDLLHRANCQVTNMNHAVDDRNTQFQLLISDIKQARAILQIHTEVDRAAKIWSHFENVIMSTINSQMGGTVSVDGMNLSQMISMDKYEISGVEGILDFKSKFESTARADDEQDADKRIRDDKSIILSDIDVAETSDIVSPVKKVYKRKRRNVNRRT